MPNNNITSNMLRLVSSTRNLINQIKQVKTHTVQYAKDVNVKFHNKIEGTIVENWVKYWKNVIIDYSDVVVDLKRQAKEKPLKAACYLSILGSVVYCAKHNPNHVHFRDTYINSANQVLLVHPSLQNQMAVSHLKAIEKCYNEKTMRSLNLGIATVMWSNHYSDECHIYASDCPYLQLQYLKFKDRIIDVGFFDRWWILTSKMKDYDINYL